MMIGKDNWALLGVGLSARIVIDTLIGFYDGEKLWHNSKEGIATISEVREILQYWINGTRDKNLKIFEFKRFKSYDEQKFLVDMVEREKWTTWESDLEQWLENKDKVMDYFSAVEQWAISSTHHGCF